MTPPHGLRSFGVFDKNVYLGPAGGLGAVAAGCCTDAGAALAVADGFNFLYSASSRGLCFCKYCSSVKVSADRGAWVTISSNVDDVITRDMAHFIFMPLEIEKLKLSLTHRGN